MTDQPLPIFAPPRDPKEDDPPPESCDGCSACCMELPRGLPPIERGDLGRLSHEAAGEYWAAVTQRSFSTRPTERLPCVWLDLESRRCRRYGERPRVCRDLKMGGPECVSFRWRWKEVAWSG